MPEDDLGPRQRAAETKKRRTRGKVVAATLDLFERGDHGADGPTLEEISEQSGVSVATLYNHFNTKFDLYLEVLEQLYEPVVRPIRTAIELSAYRPPDLRTEIVSYVYRAAVIAKEYSQLIVAYIQAYFEARVYQRWQQRLSEPIVLGLNLVVGYGRPDPYDRSYRAGKATNSYHLDMLLILACANRSVVSEPIDLARAVLHEYIPAISRNFDHGDLSIINEQLERLAAEKLDPR